MVSSVTKTRDDEVASAQVVHDHDTIGSSKEALDTAEQAHAIAFNERELALEKKLRWKIDIMIMPLIVWTYLMNYIDRSVQAVTLYGTVSKLPRNNYAAARLQGLERDLKLTDSQCKTSPFWF